MRAPGRPVSLVSSVGAVVLLLFTTGVNARPDSAVPKGIRLQTAEASATVATSESGEELPPPDCPAAVPDRLKAPRLPWPVVFTTSCGRYALFRDGRLARLPAVTEPGWVALSSAGPGVQAQVQDRHVVFTRRGDVLWRSMGTFDPQFLGSSVFGAGWLAFSVYGSDSSELYMSTVPGSERHVAGNEDPISVTATGNLIISRSHADGADPDLIVRRPDGMPTGLIARSVSVSYTEPQSGTLLYLHGRTLQRTDGVRSRTVARLEALGVPGLEFVDRLEDGRILLTGRRSIAVLDRDGLVLASATLSPIPRGGSGWVNVSSTYGRTGLILSPDPSTSGIVLIQAVWRDANAGGGPGWEGIYELPVRGTSARLLFGKPLTLAVCAHESHVSWHGRWLLYSACEGRVVAIDTTGRHPAIDLTRAGRAVPIPNEERAYGSAAEWATFATPADMARSGRMT
jgi:hypothetical protein